MTEDFEEAIRMYSILSTQDKELDLGSGGQPGDL